MADFVPSQKYASDFNKAKKYENGDAVQAETVNNLIEGQLFVQGIAANQPKVVEDNTEGEPIVYFENKDGLPRFVFKNIRGKDGKMGEKGDNGNIMRFTDSALYARSDVGTLLTIGSGNLINGQNVAVGDVVLDIHYQEGKNYYICIWEVINVSSSNAIELRGMDYISSTGGGGTVKIEIDNELSTTSENPVQNKVVTTALNTLNKTLSLSISTLDEDITDIKTGEVVVNKAENDSNGNKIINTYATKSEANSRAKTIEYSWESVDADGINPFKLNLTLKDANGNQLSTTQIDFPLEQMVVNAEYDKVEKQLILYLPDTQIPVPVADIFEGLATKTELDDTNKTVNSLSAEVSGYSQRITDTEAGIGQLQDGKLDKSGGTMTGRLVNKEGITLTSNAGSGIKTDEYGNIFPADDISAVWNVFQGYDANSVALLSAEFKTGIVKCKGNEIIHSGNIGSQNVDSAKHLITPSEYGIQTDDYGNFRQITATSGACWHVYDSNGTSRFSVYFDGSGARVGTNEVIHAGNFETYIRNYMNKKILEQPY